MKALWTLGEGTVRKIRSRLYARRPLAYTTVMTVMDRMARKGVVDRQKQGRAYLYHPQISEDQVREEALERFVANFFRGSRERLREYLNAVGATPAKRKLGAPGRVPRMPEKQKKLPPAAGARSRPPGEPASPRIPARRAGTPAAEVRVETKIDPSLL